MIILSMVIYRFKFLPVNNSKLGVKEGALYASLTLAHREMVRSLSSSFGPKLQPLSFI